MRNQSKNPSPDTRVSTHQQNSLSPPTCGPKTKKNPPRAIHRITNEILPPRHQPKAPAAAIPEFSTVLPTSPQAIAPPLRPPDPRRLVTQPVLPAEPRPPPQSQPLQNAPRPAESPRQTSPEPSPREPHAPQCSPDPRRG